MLQDGQLVLAGVEHADEGFKLEMVEIQVRSIADELYVSGAEESDPPKAYVFAWLVRMEPGEWTLRVPKIETFEAALKSGTLRGTVAHADYSTSIELQYEGLEAFIRDTPTSDLWSEDELIIRKFAADTE